MKKLLITCSLLVFFLGNAQENKKFELSAGVEYKITPFNLGKANEIATNQNGVQYANSDDQLSGLSLNVNLNWYFLKNTSIGIGQSFRYAPLFYKNSSDEGTQSPVYRLLSDTEIQAKHYFNLNNNDKLFVNLGYNFMNQNSDYLHKSNTIEKNSFNFDAYKIGVGYQYKKFEIGVGTYIVDNPKNFKEYGTSGFGFPYLKLNYVFSKF